MEAGSQKAEERVRRVVASLCGGGAGARTLEALAVLRREVLTQTDGARHLREAGGLEHLVALLQRGSDRFQDSTLSALATCCLDDESCLEVGKLNVSASLVLILKRARRDSVVGRVCRLLGNLARQPDNAETLHAAGVVPNLLSALQRRDNNTSYPTLIMIVRAIRLLWAVKGRRQEMLSARVAHALAVLLEAECDAAGLIKPAAADGHRPEDVRKSQEELLVGLLKCLGYFTTITTVDCAEQLLGDGRGYQCLVALTRTHETMAIKCLMNLCYVSACRSLLGVAGFVECLVGVLQRHSDGEWWPVGAARALAQMTDRAGNRARLLHCGGLPLLLAGARRSRHALRALLQYVFDDTTFQILISEGLVSLLTEELRSYLASMQDEHEYTEEPPGDPAGTADPAGPADPATADPARPPQKRSNSSASADNLKVVIERDNMMMGFMESAETDGSEESDTDEAPVASGDSSLRRRRARLNHKILTMMNCNRLPDMTRWPCRRGSTALEWGSSGQPWSPEYAAPHGKRPRCDWSPDSGVGWSSGEGAASPNWAGYQWSPTSSTSPNDESSDSEVSGRYSPVCSEVEPEVEEAEAGGAGEGAGAEAELVSHELEELIMENDDTEQQQALRGTEAEDGECESMSKRIDCVLVLLSRMSYSAAKARLQDEPAATALALDALTKPDCLGALLDYIHKCRRPLGQAAKVLGRVLGNALSLTPVLRQRLGMRLYGMSVRPRHPTARCKQCKQLVHMSTELLSQLRTLAESDYGVGEISYHLLKGTPAMKQILALTLPYFVRAEKPLKRYFLKCSALDTLFTSMEESHETMEEGVTALAKLASSLQIKDPKALENRYKVCKQVPYDPMYQRRSDEVVTFQLDDSSTVEANKTFLCRNSDVFRAMLMGQFKESVERCVQLKKVTKDGLECMLTLLQYGHNSSTWIASGFQLPSRLETSLEVLLLADRFLLERLRDALRSAIVQFQLSARTVCDVYVWSLTEGMGVLCVEAVAHLLAGNMSDADRVAAFAAILRLQYRQQWLDDVRAVIMRQLVL